ncbi:MAG: pyridoxamine 5'-phosphate oxidase family protein [Kiloniellales bacterium]
MDDARLNTSEQLRALYGEPGDLVRRKELPALDKHCRAFIAASPFLVIATADAKGRADASPRGDGPGFVAIVDERTLLIPDRPGNKRLDSLRNILENPNVGLIFFVPGMNETLRVNGRAEVTTDRALLEPLAVNGRVPLSGILVRIEEAYLHCAKALIRSKLWDPAVQIDRKSFPTLGRMIADQIEGVDAESAEAGIQDAYVKRLY